MEEQLVDRHIFDLFPPKLFTVHKRRVGRTGTFVDNHAGFVIDRCRLHDTCPFRLKRLFRISIDESVEERYKTVKRDVRGSGQSLGKE